MARAHRAQMLRANFDSRHAAIVGAAGYSVPLEHVEHVVGAIWSARRRAARAVVGPTSITSPPVRKRSFLRHLSLSAARSPAGRSQPVPAILSRGGLRPRVLKRRAPGAGRQALVPSGLAVPRWCCPDALAYGRCTRSGELPTDREEVRVGRDGLARQRSRGSRRSCRR